MADKNKERYYTAPTFYLENLPKQTGDYDSTVLHDSKIANKGWDDPGLALTSDEYRLFRKKPMLDDQKRSIIPLFNGDDVVWHARTGCGKTTSIMWTLLHHAVRERPHNSNFYGVRLFFFCLSEHFWAHHFASPFFFSRKPSC